MSLPEVKVSPVPVSSATRSVGSASTWANASAIASYMARVSAFFFSGRLRRISSTPLVRVMTTVSVMWRETNVSGMATPISGRSKLAPGLRPSRPPIRWNGANRDLRPVLLQHHICHDAGHGTILDRLHATIRKRGGGRYDFKHHGRLDQVALIVTRRIAYDACIWVARAPRRDDLEVRAKHLAWRFQASGKRGHQSGADA